MSKSATAEYLRGHRESGIKVGDMVKVERSCRDLEGGWQSMFHPHSMGKMVSKVFKVTKDCQAFGFELNGNYRFPYFVLDVVPKWEAKG